jgi:deoxyribonuclease-4
MTKSMKDDLDVSIHPVFSVDHDYVSRRLLFMPRKTTATQRVPVAPVFAKRCVGSHMSVSGGLALAFERIRQVGGTALQIFSRNQRQWKIPPLDPETVADFVREWNAWGPYPVFIHDSYLINLAGTDKERVVRSVNGFAAELQRAESLGVGHVITHPGSHLGAGVRNGLATYVKNLDQALERSETGRVNVLLETTAGQGTNLGSRFEELACILEESNHTDRLGICFDTCHVFAAGYDLATPEGYTATCDRLDALVGLDRIGCFHLNDSLFPCGAKRDRHEHIGRGYIGEKGFGLLMLDARFVKIPMILETPKDKDLAMDRVNLGLLKRLSLGDGTET